MRISTLFSVVSILALPVAAQAQSVDQENALKLLVPFSALLDTPQGREALAANLTVTGAVQTGTAQQPLLQGFPQAQAQALKDATVTSGNGYAMADGLGSKLGGAYQTLTRVAPAKPGQFIGPFTNISPNVAAIFAYSAALSGIDDGVTKDFFANATTLGKPPKPVPPAERAIMQSVHGTTDVFGKAYHLLPGAKGADRNGDPRPFQTEPKIATYADPDLFGRPANNQQYLTGPVQDLVNSPSFPSGHTAYDYTESLLFAEMLPERFPQMMTRAAEYGNSRIIVGAHYAMDVIGGRTLAIYDVAHLLAEDPNYVGQKEPKVKTIRNFGAALGAAKADLRAALAKACGGGIPACAGEDTSRFSDPARNEAFVEYALTYNLPAVYPAMTGKTEDVGKLAPEAGYILTLAYPKLSLEEADRILTETEGPGGGFLDDGSKFGVYSRLDLYKAAVEAAAHR